MKSRLKRTMLLCVFSCTTLCLAAQGLAILRGEIAGFHVDRFILNFCIAYPVAILTGLTVPAPRFGSRVCKNLGLQHGLGAEIIMALAVNLIFTATLSCCMTLFNVVILGKQGMQAFLFSVLGNFIPMWLASSLVSLFANKLLDRVLADSRSANI